MMPGALSHGEWIKQVEFSDRLKGGQNQKESEPQLPLGTMGRKYSRTGKKKKNGDSESPLASLLCGRDLEMPSILQEEEVEEGKEMTEGGH